MSIGSTEFAMKTVRAGALAGMLGFCPAQAQDFTAGVVMEKMEPKERAGFLAGVIEGLAHARIVSDGGVDGARCIYQWYYDREATREEIHQAFAYFKDEMPGAVIGAMLEKVCGQ